MNTSWSEEYAMLTRTFSFKDFKEALAFVTSVGVIAETLQHHPDIALKNYNTVTISTTTHDQGNMVTEKDRALAVAIDALQKKSSLRAFLTKFRILEFIIAGLVIDLVENIITIKVASNEVITWNTVLIALMVVIPFAIITELIIDHPTFWHRLNAAFKKK